MAGNGARETIGGGSYEAARAWHLARTDRDELVTTFEFALMQAFEAYQRWCVQGARLVGNPDIAFNEVVVLHVVRMQERPKDAATIAKLVNRDDLPNVLYNLRKLVSLGLVRKVKIGSGTFFEATEQGRIETERYADLRRDLLLSGMDEVANLHEKLRAMIGFMHLMTGIYDVAARSAATINPRALFPADERKILADADGGEPADAGADGAQPADAGTGGASARRSGTAARTGRTRRK